MIFRKIIDKCKFLPYEKKKQFFSYMVQRVFMISFYNGENHNSLGQFVQNWFKKFSSAFFQMSSSKSIHCRKRTGDMQKSKYCSRFFGLLPLLTQSFNKSCIDLSVCHNFLLVVSSIY